MIHSPAPEEAIREPTLAETLDRFIAACQRIHTLAEQTKAAIAAWNRRAGGEREYTREEMREACQQNYNAGRAAWRPIETAPTDGTKIDVWVKKHRITDVYWSDIQGWWCIDGHYGPEEPTPLAIIPAPTHWLALPAPPSAALARAEGE